MRFVVVRARACAAREHVDAGALVASGRACHVSLKVQLGGLEAPLTARVDRT